MNTMPLLTTGYYAVTVVSPSGQRDTYYITAMSAGHARMYVGQMLLVERPHWRATVAVKQ